MEIPTSVQVGPYRYSVRLEDPQRMRYGTVNYVAKNILIKPRGAKGQAETFWHELTHAILYEMGEHRLACNEPFVSAFGHHLARAVRTARFE